MADGLMANEREQLCIITPDSFYGVLLKEAVFPTYESRVIRGIDQLQSLVIDVMPSAFLLFASHLGPAVMANAVIAIRHRFPKAQIYQIDGVREPKIQMVWPQPKSGDLNSASLDGSSIEQIDAAMRKLSEPDLNLEGSSPSLTRSQLAVIQALAEGLSNTEIAALRNTKARAVETLVNRALRKIGATEETASRAKIVLAQKYLASYAPEAFR